MSLSILLFPGKFVELSLLIIFSFDLRLHGMRKNTITKAALPSDMIKKSGKGLPD
ncbi:MAG: hypothetical protein K0R67_2539 [Paenibacillus sp.]|jgi:hypothetical protein|nr:hypothetical protein [Paenibacillus sp.]